MRVLLTTKHSLCCTVCFQAESLHESARPLYHGRSSSLLQILDLFHKVEEFLLAVHPQLGVQRFAVTSNSVGR